MDYNLPGNLAYCNEFVNEIANLIYYTHVPSAAIALLIGTFILIRTRASLLGILLFFISIVFTGWVTSNLLIWTGVNHASLVMTAWSWIEMLNILLFILSWYFVYVFIFKKDAPLKMKLFVSALFLPMAIGAPTLYLTTYDMTECIAWEDPNYLTYTLALEIFFTLSILATLIYGYFKKATDQDTKQQILLLGFGVLFFLITFFIAGFISDTTGDFRYEMFGLFGMIGFVGVLSYLIVRFHLFNTKLIGAQALVVGLIVTIASEYVYVESTINTALVTITLILTSILGYILIKNVQREIEQRKEVERLATRLEKANKRLKILDQLKSEFVSIASHQLRSPLTSIRGYASMLLEGSYGKLSKKAHEAVERIADSSRFMALSVEDYLNVSRIQSGNMKYELSNFDVKKLANQIADDMRPEGVKRGLLITFKSSAKSTCTVHADVGKTRQIIQNLVDNALKYTKKGSIEINVSEDRKQKKMYIAIADTGIGMSKETLGTIFGKFERAQNANEVNVTGTGLGLFVARTMATKMGGNVTADSAGEGKGSTFTLELPLVC